MNDAIAEMHLFDMGKFEYLVRVKFGDRTWKERHWVPSFQGPLSWDGVQVNLRMHPTQWSKVDPA